MKKRLPFLFALTALSLSACGSVGSGFDNPFAVQLTMTFTPTTASVEQGSSTHVAVSVATTSGVNVASTYSASAPKDSGITVVPDSTGLTITASDKAIPGTYGISITSSSTSGNASGVLAVTVVKPSTTTP